MARENRTGNVSRAAGCGRTDNGAIDPRVLVGVAIAALLIGVVIWLASRDPQPEPLPEPAGGPPIETVAPAETAAERGDSAREIIDRLSAADGVPDYAEAHAAARQFQADGRLADAQLLYFFAARGGHGGAAFELATLHDPNHHSQSQSLLQQPDPFQAYRWYRSAAAAGHEAAGERLAALRAWAEEAAGSGDAQAERLLLQWE